MHLVSLRRRRWATALFLVGTLCMAAALLTGGELSVPVPYVSVHAHVPTQFMLELGFFSYAGAFLVMVLKRKSGTSRYV